MGADLLTGAATMRPINTKLRRNLNRYILQCALATLTIVVVLLFLDVLSRTAIIASLGATAFIVFTMPKSYPSGTRPLVGGYVVGISLGCLCSLLSETPLLTSLLGGHRTSLIVFGALAVGGAIFLMAITNTEHPPAAGIALGLVLNDWDYRTVIFVFGASVLLAAVRRVLRSVLIDLI